jgi:twitching motility protein PilT
MDINKLLQVACQRSASFMYLNLNFPPVLRVNGRIIGMQTANINLEDMEAFIRDFLDEEQKKIYETSGKFCLARDIGESFKTHISLFKDRQGPAAFVKIMSSEIPSPENLPPAIWSMEPGLYSGLVVIAGLASTGKSSTLAAIVNRFNEQRSYHILIIEDEMVFCHDSKKSVVNQLEVNPESLNDALKFVALKGDYNVVAIDAACGMAELGLVLDIAKKRNTLVFLVMDARSIQSVIANLINVNHGNYGLSGLNCAEVIEAILLQTLVAKQEGGGMVSAFELMIANPAVRKLIEECHLQQINSLVQVGSNYGMCVMKNSLQSLVKNGVISSKDADLAAHVLNRHENKGITKILEEYNNDDSSTF